MFCRFEPRRKLIHQYINLVTLHNNFFHVFIIRELYNGNFNDQPSFTVSRILSLYFKVFIVKINNETFQNVYKYMQCHLLTNVIIDLFYNATKIVQRWRQNLIWNWFKWSNERSNFKISVNYKCIKFIANTNCSMHRNDSLLP